MFQDTLHTVTTPVAEPVTEPAAAASQPAQTPVVAPVAPATSRPTPRPVEAKVDSVVTDTTQLKTGPAIQSSADQFALSKPDFTHWLHAPLADFPFHAQVDSLFGAPADSCVCVVSSGKAGDPVPYTFKNDNLVTSVLLLSFFLVVWVISRSRSFLSLQISDFFRPPHRENLFAERTQKEFRGQVLLILQTCFVYAILFFDYTRVSQPEVFDAVSPYKLLGASVGICSLFYLLKIVCYSFVNTIFFTAEQNRRWLESYLLSILIQGILLLPVALLMIFFDLSFNYMLVLVIAVLIVAKILLFYKCASTFFGYKFGWVHLFLYFCTLEIAPLTILLQALVSANNFLLTIN